MLSVIAHIYLKRTDAHTRFAYNYGIEFYAFFKIKLYVASSSLALPEGVDVAVRNKARQSLVGRSSYFRSVRSKVFAQVLVCTFPRIHGQNDSRRD